MEKAQKGYLTVYVSMTLTVMITFSLLLIEGIRGNTAKLEGECVADIGMNCIMAEYHRGLYDRYGLLLTDTSYGGSYPTFYNTEAHLKAYLEKNLQNGSIGTDLLYTDLLGLKLEDAQIIGVSLATDHEARVFQRQAVKILESAYGLTALEEFLGLMNAVESYGLLEDDWEDQVAVLEEELELLEDDWSSVEIENPFGAIRRVRAEGILGWVLPDTGTLSRQTVTLKEYVSKRKADMSMNRGNLPALEELNVAEQFLLRKYFLRYAGRYGKERQGSLLRYQVEYLLEGKNSDWDNLKLVASELCVMRTAANLFFLYGDRDRSSQAGKIAKVLSVLAGGQAELEEGIKAAILFGWAYKEALYDVSCLLKGGRIPLMKDNGSWKYSLAGMILASPKNDAETDGQGLSYEEYLEVLLTLTDTEELSFRFLDLVEMDIRTTAGNEHFRIDGCLGAVRAQIRFTDKKGTVRTYRLQKEY